MERSGKLGLSYRLSCRAKGAVVEGQGVGCDAGGIGLEVGGYRSTKGGGYRSTKEGRTTRRMGGSA